MVVEGVLKRPSNKATVNPDIISWEANYATIIDPIISADYIGKDGKVASLSARWCTAALFDVYDLKFVEGGIPKNGKSSIDYTVVNRAGLKALGYDSLEGAMVAEKAPMGIGMFMVALLLVALISLGTLFWQVNRAAKINPAEVIKSE